MGQGVPLGRRERDWYAFSAINSLHPLTSFTRCPQRPPRADLVHRVLSRRESLRNRLGRRDD